MLCASEVPHLTNVKIAQVQWDNKGHQTNHLSRKPQIRWFRVTAFALLHYLWFSVEPVAEPVVHSLPESTLQLHPILRVDGSCYCIIRAVKSDEQFPQTEKDDLKRTDFQPAVTQNLGNVRPSLKLQLMVAPGRPHELTDDEYGTKVIDDADHVRVDLVHVLAIA